MWYLAICRRGFSHWCFREVPGYRRSSSPLGYHGGGFARGKARARPSSISAREIWMLEF
jgi:hypothetical protein